MTKSIDAIRQAVKKGDSLNAVKGLHEEIAQRIAMVTPQTMISGNPERDNEGVAVADHGHKGNGPGQSFLTDHGRAVLEVQLMARQCGSGEVVVKDGTLYAELRSVQATKTFSEYLDAHPSVHGYELNIYRNDKNQGIERANEVGIDEITNDTSNCYFKFKIAMGE
jgi:hypothetical protein